MLFALFALVLCDNIQIYKESFTKVSIGCSEYLSESLPKGSLLKISYPGYLVYKMVEYSPGCFRLVDRTVYIGKSPGERLLFVIEVVEVRLGMSPEIPGMFALMVNLAMLGLSVFGHLVPQYLDRHVVSKEKAD